MTTYSEVGGTVPKKFRLVIAVALTAAGLGAVPGALGEAAYRRFDPAPKSSGTFSIVPPSADPESQTREIVATKPAFVGTTDTLYYEVWLPGMDSEGEIAPERVPAILTVTPYVSAGVLDGDNVPLMERAVAAGYAYVQAHIRGTGSSGGCLDDADPEDVADFIEDIASQPWSDRTVGLYGISHRGFTALQGAAVAPKERISALKAVVAGGAYTNHYDWNVGMDGVQAFMSGSEAIVFQQLGRYDGAYPGWREKLPERETCAPRRAGLVSPDGSVTAEVARIDLRRRAKSVTTPVLIAHGLGDTTVYPTHILGFFEQLPATTPKAAVIGNFNHEWPDGHDWESPGSRWNTIPEWSRVDWVDMALAWFDRYMRGFDTGVERWPVVQVQSNDGSWREERDWPWTGNRAGQLALGPGTLGTLAPQGSSTYTEGRYWNGKYPLPDDADRDGHADGSVLRFVSEPLAGPLAIVGQPVLDLWVSMDRDDAHLVASIEVLDAEGRPLQHVQHSEKWFWKWSHSTFGARSMQHLDPLVDNRFVQGAPRPAPETTPFGTLEPVHVEVRFQPRDWIIPAGSKIVVTVAGSMPWRADGETEGFYHPFQVSGRATKVTIHHDCDRPSALRFLMRDEKPTMLSVETIEGWPVPAPPGVQGREKTSGGGLATTPVCGRGPDTDRPSALGPLRIG